MRPVPALAAIASLLASACASAPPARCDYPAVPPASLSPAPPYRYAVSASPRGEELCVEVSLPPGTYRLRAARDVLPYVRDVTVSSGGMWTAAEQHATGFDFAGCDTAPCRARYRVMLGYAARVLDERDTAMEARGVLVAPASSWLLRPTKPLLDGRYELHVSVPPGSSFVSGVFPGPGENVYQGNVADLEESPYAAFGALSVKRAPLPGGEVMIGMSPGSPRLGRPRFERWIETATGAVAQYFGRFPIPHAATLVAFNEGEGIGGGATLGMGGGSVLLFVGEGTSEAQLVNDWILVHELCHVSFPNVARPWAEEGMATYLEPLIRARAGLVSPDQVWRDLLEGLPLGQPEAGDEGLDHSDTWGRRYWGGAMFWFLADVEIRKRTNNARSVGDAFRGIVARGGNVSVAWSLDKALGIGDEATGLTVLRDLRKQHGDAAVTVDLDALWNDLGVHLVKRKVVYDDNAKLAAVRKAIVPQPGP
jgi:hypothetical protein